MSGEADIIPAIAELAALGSRFLAWRNEDRGGKPTKVPYRPLTGCCLRAESDNPASWGTYAEANQALAGGGYDGVGFVPRPAEDGIFVDDLDGCIDPESGEIAQWAAEIVEHVDSYTEISPSGTGLKVFARASRDLTFPVKEITVDAPKLCSKQPQIEILANKYTTLTGAHLGGTPQRITEAGGYLDNMARWMAEHRASIRQEHRPPRETPWTIELLLRAAEAIPNGDLPWSEWSEIGLRFWAATDGSEAGIAAFDAFSQKSNKYEARATRQRWSEITRSPPTRFNASSLLIEARKYDPEIPDPANLIGQDVDFSGMMDRLAGMATVAVSSPYDIDGQWDADLITGPAPPIDWLVKGSLPRGVAALLAAMGDTGKSFKMLELGLRIATYDERREMLARPIFGGNIVAAGTVVFLTAEEDRKAIHRRLEAVDPEGLRHKYAGRLKIVTLPDAGGPKPLIIVSGKGELQLTEDCKRLFDSLRRIQDLALFMLDPTQAFVHANINADPAAAQFFCSTLAAIGAETGACALASHHMRKPDNNGKEIETSAEARNAIRGTSALVDGVRVAHVMWPAPEGEAKKDCKALGVEWQPNRVVWGGVAKGNEIAGRDVQRYFRTDSGLLLDRTMDLRNTRTSREDLEDEMVAAIALAAVNERPLQKIGKAGLFENRERLPEELRGLGRDPLRELCQRLLDSGRVVKTKAGGSNIAQWLDVPGGPFAQGIGAFAAGYRK